MGDTPVISAPGSSGDSSTDSESPDEPSDSITPDEPSIVEESDPVEEEPNPEEADVKEGEEKEEDVEPEPEPASKKATSPSAAADAGNQASKPSVSPDGDDINSQDDTETSSPDEDPSTEESQDDSAPATADAETVPGDEPGSGPTDLEESPSPEPPEPEGQPESGSAGKEDPETTGEEDTQKPDTGPDIESETEEGLEEADGPDPDSESGAATEDESEVAETSTDEGGESAGQENPFVDIDTCTEFSGAIEADKIQTYISNISVVVDEVRIAVTKDGLHARAVDAAGVQMVDTRLSSNSFERYSGVEGLLGFKVGRFENIIGQASKDDLIQLDLDAQTRKMHINFDGLTFTMGLIDPESIRSLEQLPDLQRSATVELEGSTLKETMKGAQIVMLNTLELVGTDDAFYVKTENDTDDMQRKMVEGDTLVSYENSADEEVSSIFSSDYVTSTFKKVIDHSDRVTIEFGEDIPTSVKQQAHSGAISFHTMLAPRIESQ